MRRAWFLLLAGVLFGAVWVLQNDLDRLRFVVPSRAEVLYATTFDSGTLAADWSAVERRGGTIAVRDDALHLSFDAFITRRELLRSTSVYPFADFDLRATATALEGDINNAFGLVLRQSADANTYLLFYVSSDGYYSIWRETPNGRLALSTWIASDAVQQGLGAQNRLRAVAQGNTFRFYVNGTPLMLCIPNNPSGESTYTVSGGCIDGTMQPQLVTDAVPLVGVLGVAIETQIDGALEVAFDDLLVMPANP